VLCHLGILGRVIPHILMKHSKNLFAAILMAASVTGAMAQTAPDTKVAPAQAPAQAAKAAPGAEKGLKIERRGGEFKPVTRAEAIQRVTDQFDRTDVNKDGIVTNDEIRAVQAEMRARFERERAQTEPHEGKHDVKHGGKHEGKPGGPLTKPAPTKNSGEPAPAK
jgi:hypothetical protein